MPANYVLLEKITVGAAGASSVTFLGIPQTGYTDLVIKYSSRDTSADFAENVAIQFNGVGGTSYSERLLRGAGSSVGSFNRSSVSAINYLYSTSANATSTTFSNGEIYIPNYTGSSNKSVSVDSVTENNATSAYTALTAGLFSNTSAITSIALLAGVSFVANSTFYLYGVAKLGTTPVIVPYATGGDIIDTDGTYWYHTFLSSGTFTPQKGISCDYLVVAGGAGGGEPYGGGGGAGGLRSTVTATGGGGSLETPLSLGTSAYTVTVGAGGAGGSDNVPGTNGNNSIFSTITSTGGGAGGSNGSSNGSTGGSGGGGSYSRTGGAGTTNQGFAGGNGASGSLYGGGGGGGASAVGAVGTTTVGGNGGNGVAVSISGSSVTYAGGGGGGIESSPGTAGAGGTGGGGAGAIGPSTQNAVAGTANRGGGGGGGAYSTANGAAGGSGIVIIRYAV
jgi:hypothetical protein